MDASNSIPSPERLLAERAWLVALARRLVRDESEADDLAQSTLVAALERPPAEDRPLRPWLVVVAQRTLAQRRRSDGRRRLREERVAPELELPSSEDMVERVDTQRHVAGAVLALEEPYRTMLLLRYYEGCTPAEIARRRGIPAGTVRSRLAEGRERLRRRLDHEHGGERQAWMAGVLALAESPPVPVRAAIPLTALAGGLLVKFGFQFAIGALVLIAAGAAVLGGKKADGSAREVASPSNTPSTIRSPQAAAERALSPDQRSALLAREASVEEAREEPFVASRAATITGRLVDRAGRGVPGVAVVVMAPHSHPKAMTDAAGDFVLEAHAIGGQDNSRPRVRFHTQHAAWARRVLDSPLPSEGDQVLGEIVLEPGGVASGWVLDRAGQPLSGVEVRPIRYEWTNEELEQARLLGFRGLRGVDVVQAISSADGSFELFGLPAGPTRVAAQLDGYLGAASEGFELVSGQPTRELQLLVDRLQSWQTIRGVVTDSEGQPVPGVLIEHGPDGTASHAFRSEACRPDGSFSLRIDQQTGWTLRATSSTTHHRSVALDGVEPGSEEVVLMLGDERWMDLRLESQGEPLQRVRMDVLSEDGKHLSSRRNGAVQSTADGTFGFAVASESTSDPSLQRVPVPEEPFRVSVRAEGFEPAKLGPFDPLTAPAELVVPLRPASASLLRGIVFAQGDVLPGTFVMLVPAPAAGASWWKASDSKGDLLEFVHRLQVELNASTRSTNANGEFALHVEQAGQYYVVATHAGGEGKRTGAALAHGPIEIDPAQLATAEPIRLELTPGGSLEGRVLVPEGRTPGGMTVGATRGDGLLFHSLTDAEGRYRFEHLGPGQWQVARSEGSTLAGLGKSARTPVPAKGDFPFDCEISEGETTHFDLDLREEAAECTLLGTLTVNGEPAVDWNVSVRAANSNNLFAFQSTKTDAEGRFEIHKRSGGLQKLTLQSRYRGTLLSLDAHVELIPGQTERSFELSTGVLEGQRTGPPETWSEYLFYYTELAPASWTLTAFQADGSGRFELGGAPTGTGRIVRRGSNPFSHPSTWETVREVRVTRTGRTVIELP